MKWNKYIHFITFGLLTVVALIVSIFFAILAGETIFIIAFLLILPFVYGPERYVFDKYLKNTDSKEERERTKQIGKKINEGDRRLSIQAAGIILFIYYIVFGSILQGSSGNPILFTILAIIFIPAILSVTYWAAVENGQFEITIQIEDPKMYIQRVIRVLNRMHYSLESNVNDLFVFRGTKDKNKKETIIVSKSGIYVKHDMKVARYREMKKKILKLQDIAMDHSQLDSQVSKTDSIKQKNVRKIAGKRAVKQELIPTTYTIPSHREEKLSIDQQLGQLTRTSNIRIRKLKSDIYSELSWLDNSIILTKFARNKGYLIEEIEKLLILPAFDEFGHFDKMDQDIYTITRKSFIIHKWGTAIGIAFATSILTIILRSIFIG